MLIIYATSFNNTKVVCLLFFDAKYVESETTRKMFNKDGFLYSFPKKIEINKNKEKPYYM